MNKKFLLLLEEIGYSDSELIRTGTLNQIVPNDFQHTWTFDITFSECIDIEIYKKFIEHLIVYKDKFPNLNRIEYCITRDHYSNDDFLMYYKYIIEQVVSSKPTFQPILDYKVEIREKVLFILCERDATFVRAIKEDIEERIDMHGFDFSIDIDVDESIGLIQERIRTREIKTLLDMTNKNNGNSLDNSKTYIGYESLIKGTVRPIKDIPADTETFIHYRDEFGKAIFIIEGEVTGVEMKDLRNDSKMFSMIISDADDSIFVKKFIRKSVEYEFCKTIEKGMWAKVKGYAEDDTYKRDIVLTATNINRTREVVKKAIREDGAEKKRVELHCHTQMSTLDGVTNIADYVTRVNKWGHRALAITDHGNLQAFPDFVRSLYTNNIKPIYGVELSLVDEADYVIVREPIDSKFSETTFVVFDIETTSLSTNYGDIIEIGAIKIKGEAVVGKYSKFINPQKPIPAITTRITSISDIDVKSADIASVVLPDFKEWCGDSVLVAHNSSFDMGHIYENYKKLGIYDGLVPNIDTLQLARVQYGDKIKRFGLKAMCRFFKVDLKTHHRADADAQATSEVFLHMLKDLNKLGIRNVKDINKVIDKATGYKTVIPKHVNLLVKNDKGLKNLFRIVSEASTNTFYKEARITKKFLADNSDGILIGSGCMNSSVFEAALNKPYFVLLNEAKQYDYLEVQPPSNYIHLIEDMDDGENIIIKTISKIIKAGEELGIPVVATSDCHQLDPEDLSTREICISAPRVGGGLHPLYRYKNKPSQYLRTTQEMLEEFSFLSDSVAYDIVIGNTNLIADLVDDVKVFKKKLYAPQDDFLADQGIVSVERTVKQMVKQRSEEMYGTDVPQIVQDRIDKELSSIIKNKFSSVYYISHLLVKKSLSEGYLVGSRGSVGSSIIATMLDITEVNPLPPHYVCPKCYFSVFKMNDKEIEKYGYTEEQQQYVRVFESVESGIDLPDMRCSCCNTEMIKDGNDIPFEIFLGFEGEKIPDIDLNFSGDNQSGIHDYLKKIFGKDRAFRAGTISTIKEKTAFGYIKGYIEKTGAVLRKAEIERRSKKLIGIRRSTGQHPGGIVVVPSYKDIYDVTPVQYPSDDTSSEWLTTHFEYHSFEDNLFKFDVLGHDDPTMINYLMKFVDKDPLNFPFKDAQKIPIDNPLVFRMFSSTEALKISPKDVNTEVSTFGVPEFGTKFVRDMLIEAKPSNFAELCKISGLSHGTDVWRNNAQDLVNGDLPQFGKVDFINIIGCRDDIFNHLMHCGLEDKLAFEIAEFVRKGKADKMIVKWDEYVSKMRACNVEEWFIWSCSKIKYLFPKAHATAYVMMALRIAWFKVHRPICFYSAYFSKRAVQFDAQSMISGTYGILEKMKSITNSGSRPSDKDSKLLTTLEVALEMYARGISFKQIDIVNSHPTEFLVDGNSLLMPFIVIDGLGDNVANSIIEAREEKLFTTKKDIKTRTKLSKTLFGKLEMLGVFNGYSEDSQMSFDL